MKHFYFDSLSVLAQKEILQTHENVVPMCLTISLWLQTETPFLSATEPQPSSIKGTILLCKFTLQWLPRPSHILYDGVQWRVSLLGQQLPARLDPS